MIRSNRVRAQIPGARVMSKVMSSCAAACWKATRQAGGWAWRSCNTVESLHGSGSSMDYPTWTDRRWPVLNLAGYPAKPHRSQPGRPISWSGCWRVWHWARSGRGDRP